MTGTSWRGRRPLLDYLHVALPPTAVLTYRRQSLAILAQNGLQIHQTGLWGHTGLFSLVYSGMDIPTQTEVHTVLLQRCQDLQGAMEYCHGVGTRLAPLMAREHGAGLVVLQRLKHSLDPQGIMNPGKLALLGEQA
jgi:FAD/FMN-containing dehydrogenase